MTSKRGMAAPRAARRAPAALATALLLTAGAALAAPPKPVVVVFLSGIPARSRSEADQVLVNRTRGAARAVRDRFLESGVVDPVLYDPELPMFVRAMREADVKPADPADPSDDERVAIAKAVGALYAVEVATHDPPADKGPAAIDLEMRATSVETRKAWDESALASAAGGGLTGGAVPADATASGNAVASAANTLVVRFLGGPMRDYYKDAVPPSLLPPGAAGAVSAAPPAGAAASPGRESGAVTPVAPPSVGPPAPTPVPVTPAAPTPAPAGPVVGPVPQPAAPAGPDVPAPAVKPAPTNPAPIAPTPAAEPVTDSSQGATDAQAEALRQQGEQQVAAGEAEAAVLSLRRAVNLAPTSTRMRLSLVRAYAAAGRYADAIAEGRRALTVAHPDDRAGRLDITRAMADALRQQGDTKAARALYEDIIAAQPATSNWARVALGDVLYGEGDTAGAETQYRAALKAEPQGRDALIGLARVLASQGDYEGALKQMTAAQPADANGDAALARYATVRSLFDDGAARVAKLLRQNREAYRNRTLGREPFYKATEAQSARVAGLLKLLRSVPPPAGAGADAEKAHRKRIFAASLLSQAVEEMLSDLETGKPDADSQATVLLDEFDREMVEAGTTGGGAAG